MAVKRKVIWNRRGREPRSLLQDGAVFVHARWCCHKANRTQQTLRDEVVDSIPKTDWPGNSPDLNPKDRPSNAHAFGSKM